MERDCMIAHGTSKFLKERLFEQSDPYSMFICDKCGNIATSKIYCKVCENDTPTKINIPYVTKLLLQELNCMGIKTMLSSSKR